MRVKQAIQSLDAFPRAEEHLLLKTQSGAFVSVIGLVIMATLFYHELAYYLTTYTVHQMSVDLKRGEILPIHVNITFPSLPCDVVSVDAIDMSGKHEVDLDTNIWKLRLNSQGHITGTEYLSDLVEKEHDAHNHDHDKDHHNDSHEEQHAHGFDDAAETMIKKVKQALANGEGCRVYGVLDVQRVAGNFHISVHGLNILWKVQIEENGLKSIGYNLWKEDRACLQWLDTKEPKSVVYVNFGSVTVMTADQLVEFAMGLANSKISFLWIIRPDLVTGESAVLPAEFAETENRSFITSWCPQEEVLNHPAVGGFLTHSGWGSTIESLCAGVPMVCWPFFADQAMNCRYSCNEWGVGMEIDNNVKREGVEMLVKELMEGGEGEKMRGKAMEWKRLAEEAAGPKGTSSINLDKFIHEIISSNS